ncbi:nucleotidyltransferase family protein [Nostoc sp. CCY0012]|uniref:nucleotidyltransferase family protein n=1 Tax=Nostoc sp. CCY0012 TaxID=1056123 RepID=UPI0039C6BDD0
MGNRIKILPTTKNAIMTLNDLTPVLREQIKQIAAQHGAFNVRVFGSVARNEADQNSDLDLIVDYDLDKISLWFPVRLIRELEELLGVKVDVVTPTGLKDRIRTEVLQEALPL